jgi:hypothetical protein
MQIYYEHRGGPVKNRFGVGMVGLILHKAILSPDYVKVALFGRPPDIGPFAAAEPRSQTCNWLLGQVSRGAVLWDYPGIRLKRLDQGSIQIAVPS